MRSVSGWQGENYRTAKVSGVVVGLRTTREIDLQSLNTRTIVIYDENRYKTQFPDLREV